MRRTCSNELNTPKILACPAEFDSAKVQATTFASSIASGTGTPFKDNTSISYFVGTDANETSPQMFLTGDHNMGPGAAANNNAATTYWKNQLAPNTQSAIDVTTNNPGAAWMDNQHQKQGNVGLADGSVQGFSISRLRDGLKNTGATANNRLLFP